ncbi:hypothetical protein [Nonomuraea jabiensis]|uniref:hypothetical protein n=1 Tax=Nonomuraea jabiensis TaxID=882448 RepID=UPI003D710842
MGGHPAVHQRAQLVQCLLRALALAAAAGAGGRLLVDPAAYHGWLDDGHFLAGTPDGKSTDVVLADATGRTLRKLAAGPKAEIDRVVLWFTRK